MNDLELTQLFIDYAQAKQEAAELEKRIETAILENKSSQKIAGVKATYYAPSKETNYEAAARAHPDFTPEITTPYSSITAHVRWAEVAQALGADVTPFTSEKPARVVVK